MKKVFMMVLIGVLMLSNVNICRADTGPIQVQGLITIPEGYEDESFTITTNIYNNGTGYRNVTIIIQDNDINLSVDKTQLRIPGNQGINIKITGTYPKADNNNIFANLKIVDDLNYTNDQEIHFFAPSILKKDTDDPNDPTDPTDPTNPTYPSSRLSQVTNVQIRYNEAKKSYIVTWDPVKNAKGYMIEMYKNRSDNRDQYKNVLTNQVEFKTCEVGKCRGFSKVIFKIYAYSPKRLASHSIASWCSTARRNQKNFGTMDWYEYIEQESENTQPRRGTGSHAGNTGNTNTGNGSSTRRPSRR